MELEPQPPAPAVVAVVVTCDPGPWFEQVLTSLESQDYPNLSVLVIDSASSTDPTDRVAAILRGAFVSRLEHRVGFGRAANEVLKLVEGASHYLFCHDDVAFAPDAIRSLVEEAFRSNAGIASPKYVEWDHPDRLLAVGATVDKVGVLQGLVDPGELDQEQHDVVREVFVAPGGATLVRADLFRAIGGFNATIDQFGEDLDLSWRALVAGARVVVVPAARVRHLQALHRGERTGWESPVARRRAGWLADEHRVRTMVTCYRWFDLAWIAPLAVLFMLGEAVTRLVQGRPGDAGHVVGSFARAFRNPGRLWRSRRRVQRGRQLGDSEIRRMQVPGNARFRAFVRARVEEVREGLPPAPVAGARVGAHSEAVPGRRAASLAGRLGAVGTRARRPGPRFLAGEADDDVSEESLEDGAAGRDVLSDGSSTPTGASTTRRLTGLVAVALLVVVLFGSRSLLGNGLPAIGQLPNFSGGWSGLWGSWWSTWQQGGLGVTAPSSPALALLGLLGTALFGAMGTLQHVVVLGPLLLGPLGAYRAARWWGSRRGRLAALIGYAVVPLPYDALARGHWNGLVAYAAAPWVLSVLGRLSGEIPFPVTRSSRIGGRVLGLGLLVALVAAVAPAWLVVVPVVGVALLAGSALARQPQQGLRMLAVAAGATVVAVLLLLPWSWTILGSRTSMFGVSPGPGSRLGLGQILRFDTGPVGHGPLGWAFLAAAALPLVIGQGWRLAWATRLWAVAVASIWLTWAGVRGWVPAVPVEVGLAPAAAALAGSIALGAVSFELDLPGFRFGWRQLAAGLAGAALALASIPMLAASGQGRWNLPSADASSVLAFLPDSHAADYRVLWVGAPDALPLAGRKLDPGIAYATSYDGEPSAPDLWVAGRQGATSMIASDLHLAENHLTTKLGHLLAPMAVFYLVLPNHNAPAGSGAAAVPNPGALLAGLQQQTDMQIVNNVDPNYVVYRNWAWAPGRAVLPVSVQAGSFDGQAGQRSLQQTDLTGAQAVLTGGDRSRGPVPLGSTIYVSATRDPAWRLRVGAASIAPQPAFGWAASFAVPAGFGTAKATLHEPSSTGLRFVILVDVLLWLGVVGVAALDLRRRRSEHPSRETVLAEWFVPSEAAPRPGRWRPGRAGGLGADDLKGDEVWIDV